MKTVDRHIGRRMLGTFLRTVLALCVLFVFVDILTHRRADIAENDVPLLVVGQYYAALLPEILIQYRVAALSMLVTTLLVLGSAAQHHEFAALLSAGAPLRRIVVAPLLIAAALSGLILVTSETVGPRSAGVARSIEENYFGKGSRSSMTSRGGLSWTHLADDWKCHITKFNRIAMTGEDVLMLALRDDVQEQIRARRIFWDERSTQWLLEDVVWSVFYPERGMSLEARRFAQVAAPFADTPDQLFAAFVEPETKSAQELRAIMADAASKSMPLTRLQLSFHTKFAEVALPFIMVLLAIPFATRLRRGGLAVGFGLSIALGITYMVLFAIAHALGQTGQFPPFLAAWLANFVFLGLGLTLFARTAT